MERNSSKHNKKFWDLFLPIEFDCLDKLSLEFEKVELVADLIRQRMAMYERIENGLSDELKSVLLDYEAINNHISSEQQKFFFRNGVIKLMRFVRLLFGSKSSVKLDIHVL